MSRLFLATTSEEQEMTQLFESYSTWNHLVGCTQRVWFSDTDEKRQQTDPWHAAVAGRTRVSSQTSFVAKIRGGGGGWQRLAA